MAANDIFVFHRPELAKQFCDALEGKSALLDKRSGLFLAAMRRVGKTTWLRQDLLPEAKQRKWCSIIVDLWADKTCDPANLLIRAIKQALLDNILFVGKTAIKTGFKTVNVAGFSFNMDARGIPEGVTLTAALQALHGQVKRPILLMIDEAQHALISEAGLNAMFALKAARDAMNRSDQAPALMLAFVGSDRDKLTQLCAGPAMPFMGSSVTAFPLLDREFTDAYTAKINTGLAATNQFKPEDVFEAFKMVGQRPEFLREIISTIALDAIAAPELGSRLKTDAWVKATVWKEFEQAYSSLSGLQKAIVRVMASSPAGTFSPFSKASMDTYGKVAAKLTSGAVQKALVGLRDKGYVWKEARGSYELGDAEWATWLKSNDLI